MTDSLVDAREGSIWVCCPVAVQCTETDLLLCYDRQQQRLYRELAGFMKPKYFAGICQFDILGEEGNGRRAFQNTVLARTVLRTLNCV